MFPPFSLLFSFEWIGSSEHNPFRLAKQRWEFSWGCGIRSLEEGLQKVQLAVPWPSCALALLPGRWQRGQICI